MRLAGTNQSPGPHIPFQVTQWELCWAGLPGPDLQLLAASPELDQRVRTNGQSAGRGNLGPPGHSDPIRAELNQAPGNYTHPPPTRGYAHLEPALTTEKIANSMCDLSNNATETTDSGFYKNCRKRTDHILNLNTAETV